MSRCLPGTAGATENPAVDSALLDAIDVGLLVIDRSFRILQSNRRIEGWVHRSHGEMRGQQCFRVFHNADEVCADCPCRVVFRKGEPATTSHTGRDAQGGTMRVRISARPLFNDNGEVIGALESVYEVSDEQRRDAELARRNGELEVLNRVLAAVNSSLDLDVVLERALDSALGLTTPAAVGGIFLVDERRQELRLVAHRGLDASFVARERTVKLGECLCGLTALCGEVIASNDSLRDVRHTHNYSKSHAHVIVPLKSHGRVLGVLFLYPEPGYVRNEGDERIFALVGGAIGTGIENASLYQRTDEQLREKVEELTFALAALNRSRVETEALERVKDDYIAMLSHDLRAPLNAITMAAAVLQRPSGITASERSIAAIVRSAERMLEMINDLVDSAKLQSGRMLLRCKRLPAAHMVARTVERAFAEAERQRIRITYEAEGLFLTGDREWLERAITNILSNALKYSPDGSPVSLVLGRDERDAFVVRVIDHGIGIAAEDLPKLGSRFWRARGASRPGTGLGLYIARSVVEAHGGCFLAESRVGEGSTVGFTLPCSR